jgi:hypothetical protein
MILKLQNLIKHLEKQNALDCQLLGSGELERYAKYSNKSLLELWQKEGFCGYDDGLWWFTPPDRLDEVLKSFLPNMLDAHVLARTAFGDLFIHSVNNKISVFSPRLKEMVLTDEEFEFFFEVLLINEEFKLDILEKELFNQAQKKIGPINHEECYGFLPPLKLGGNFSLENLEKVKLMEHLMILSQV